MTTITNFLESNFIDNQSLQARDSEITQNPIWILNTQVNNNSLQTKAIEDYVITYAVQSLKPVIHIDLGLNLVKKYPSSQYKGFQIENSVKMIQPIQNKPYFIVKTPISQRIKENFLSTLIERINSLYTSKILGVKLNQCNLPKKYEKKFCLLVEGIEAMLLLGKTKEVQSFISQLSNLHNSIKQVTILSKQKLMNKQLMFSLQRISTCLTTLVSYNSVDSQWECLSTVRRYTGYSNQEVYTMTYNKVAQKIKVAKKLNIINFNQETKQQKQMVESLGFVVKKGEQDKKKQQQLRKMIYPHLKIQQQNSCECGPQSCKNTQCSTTENLDEGLIILDEQQEDQDDVDV